MNILKKSALIVALASIALSSAMVYARITHTLLVLDQQNSTELPGKFRTTSDPLPDSTNIQKLGLENIHAIGSQQITSDSFKTALQHIPSSSVVVVDLRRESHGIINGDAVSWYGPQNAANINKTIPQIRQSEARLIERTRKAHYRWIYNIISKTDDDYLEKVEREFIPVNYAQSEQKMLQDLHVGYQRFYVEDFHAPSDEEATRFVNFAKSIKATTWLYFHCRAGKGRTTTFMSMYDMMKNAKQVAFDDIIARQFELGGADLRDFPSENSFKHQFAVERFEFLKSFYEYAKQNNDNFSTSYIAWKKNHAGKVT